ncbi:MAG TPA: hypothetical protein VK853_10835 [Ilumatobacteraceae bacterium]|nr:hypothetical protein [Ilumatobacteraceae bacterium]
MRKKIAIALTAGVAAATMGLGAAGTASAAPQGAGQGGKPIGISCMQYGHSVLRTFGSPAKASQDILGLPLNQVLALHRNAPATAAGILIGLGLPESDVTAACGNPA